MCQRSMVLQNYQNFTEMYHLLWTTNRNHEYRISANSFCGNYSFLNLTFDHSTYRCGNYSREKTIQGRKLLAEIRYSIKWMGILFLPNNKKNVHLQGFWPKSVYLKCFGNKLKTVYLQGLHSLRPCISRPCCISF